MNSVTATFLFTDLVDSTALSSRLGPEASESLRQAHFGILRGAAETTGGFEVKSTGDGLMLMFTSPSRALACAVAIQQGIERHNHPADEPLAVRIGLSMGEATEEDGDYYGDTVVEAARLCAAAEGGQILTTDLLRMLVGRHASQTFMSVGDLELKGIPEPVPAVAVVWEPESSPGVLAVGRREEATARYEQFRHRVRAMPRNAQWLTAVKNLTDAVVQLEDREIAAALYNELAPFGDQIIFPTVVVSGSAWLPLGRLATLLERYDDAKMHLERSLETRERIGARYYLACTHLELATLSSTRGNGGDKERVREHVAQSLALVDAHGFDGLRPRLEGLQATLDG